MEFRYAEREDTPLILEFIKELTDYEHMLDEVVADVNTPTFLGRAGIYLEDLYVRPEHRGAKVMAKLCLSNLLKLTLNADTVALNGDTLNKLAK